MNDFLQLHERHKARSTRNFFLARANREIVLTTVLTLTIIVARASQPTALRRNRPSRARRTVRLPHHLDPLATVMDARGFAQTRILPLTPSCHCYGNMFARLAAFVTAGLRPDAARIRTASKNGAARNG